MRENRRDRRRVRPVYAGFFVTLFTAAVILNLLYLVYYSHNARKLDETERTRILNQTVFYINRYMKEVEDGANMLSVSSPVQKLLTYRAKKDYMDYVNGMEQLSEYAIALPDIYRIDLYVHSTQTLLTSYEGVYYELPEEAGSVYEGYMESGENWFWDLHYGGKEPKLVSGSRNEQYITLIKPVHSKYTGKKAGVLCMSVRVKSMEELISIDNSQEEGICLYYRGEPLLGRIPENKGIHLLSMISDYSGMEVDYYYTPQLGRIITTGFVMTIMIITALFAAIFFCIVRISERKMFDPVGALLEGFQKVEEGCFELRLDESRSDMFGSLFCGFNHMAARLEQMIQELSNERTRRNEFKFRLLQMQIKPHFLYNLFNNMVWMVEQKDYERLEVLIGATAGYYKTALNYGNQDIMLMDNKRQLEYYGEIQKIRFGNRFFLDIDFSQEVLLHAIPNLLLQPLVENAIVHGLKEEAGAMTWIRAKAEEKGEAVVIAVSDDGKGIAPEILEDIRREMENYEGDGSRYFALVNIAARLHNRYKEKASVTIDSRLGQGTVVILKIPLKEVKSCIG